MSNARTFTGSAEINAMVARVAPAILGLLADGVPRTKAAIVEALAGRHDKQDVVHALIRLAVTGRLEETGGKYALAADEDLTPAQTSHRQARPTAATSQATARARQGSVAGTGASGGSIHSMASSWSRD